MGAFLLIELFSFTGEAGAPFVDLTFGFIELGSALCQFGAVGFELGGLFVAGGALGCECFGLGVEFVGFGLERVLLFVDLGAALIVSFDEGVLFDGGGAELGEFAFDGIDEGEELVALTGGLVFFVCRELLGRLVGGGILILVFVGVGAGCGFGVFFVMAAGVVFGFVVFVLILVVVVLFVIHCGCPCCGRWENW